MHILITNLDHYADRPGGAPRLVDDEARYLAAAGHQVTVLAAAVRPDSPEREQAGGVCLLRYYPREYHVVDPRRSSAHQKAARDVLRKHISTHVDVVHGHSPLTHLAACDLFADRARTVYTIHSPVTMEMGVAWPRDTFRQKLRHWLGLPVLRRMESACLQASVTVTALSEFTRGQMVRLHGQELGGKVRVFPGWVDLDRFRILSDRDAVKNALGWPVDVPVLFTLRRLVPRMGLDRLVRAIGMVRDRGKAVRLVIGGDGPLRHQLQSLAASLDLAGWTQFVGRVSDLDLPRMYGGCDAFVLPTAALECFGLIALEALACGRPVLATPVAAIPEVISNFESRWLAASADDTAIADLICTFLAGDLPAHAPAELRWRTEELYSQETRLAELAQLVLGGNHAASISTSATPAGKHSQRLKKL